MNLREFVDKFLIEERGPGLLEFLVDLYVHTYGAFFESLKDFDKIPKKIGKIWKT